MQRLVRSPWQRQPPKLSCVALDRDPSVVFVASSTRLAIFFALTWRLTGIFMASPNQRHLLSALVQNVPGVLAHISGMLASRGYNIDSLAVGETEDPTLSRMTFVVVGDDQVLDQVRKQLEKIVTVVRVLDISSNDYVERDLLLVKVTAPAGGVRSEIRELVDIFRGQIVDVGEGEVMIEISGRANKVQAFIERIDRYGIVELVRTGRIAMVRSGSQITSSEPAAETVQA
ncbi:acetolactate synthase small subunit [Rhodopirellula europaea 6C]|uniref:acetolactate synthase n=2 Tax=Rhodopirellula TaxID=265488 RepID=M2B8Q5_9BACT|nr:acetolactate synthase small subunit [Rhodopirellula europaea 6C]